MRVQTLRRLFTLAALTLLSATLVLAQSTPIPKSEAPESATWAAFLQANRFDTEKVYVVTTADPNQENPCHIKSMDEGQLICSNFGEPKQTYRASEIAAIIRHGNHQSPWVYITSYLAAEGAAITGAVVLASISTAGAVVVAVIAGYLLLGMPYSFATIDEQSADTILYLAPHQTLQVKLRPA